MHAMHDAKDDAFALGRRVQHALELENDIFTRSLAAVLHQRMRTGRNRHGVWTYSQQEMEAQELRHLHGPFIGTPEHAEWEMEQEYA